MYVVYCLGLHGCIVCVAGHQACDTGAWGEVATHHLRRQRHRQCRHRRHAGQLPMSGTGL